MSVGHTICCDSGCPPGRISFLNFLELFAQSVQSPKSRIVTSCRQVTADCSFSRSPALYMWVPPLSRVDACQGAENLSGCLFAKGVKVKNKLPFQW